MRKEHRTIPVQNILVLSLQNEKKRTGLPIYGGTLANAKEHPLLGFMPYIFIR
jgi:hypothetical protein